MSIEVTLIAKAVMMFFLVLLSVQDILSHSLRVRTLVVFFISGVICAIWQGTAVQVLIGSLIPGIFFVCVSRLTAGSVGMGDALTVMAIGLFLGFWSTVSLVGTALLLSIIPAAAQEKDPFCPFSCHRWSDIAHQPWMKVERRHQWTVMIGEAGKIARQSIAGRADKTGIADMVCRADMAGIADMVGIADKAGIA